MGLLRIVKVQGEFLRRGRWGGALRGFQAMGERMLARLPAAPRVACNLCGWRGARFLSAYYFDRFRRGVFCPACGSMERHRTLKLAMEAEMRGFFASSRRSVLDVAPIDRSRDLFPTRELDYLSFDLFSPRAMVRGDLRRAPFPDGAFDFVLCCHVLEHIREEGAALREIRRLLRPGGCGVVQVPWDPALPRTEEYAAPRPEEEGHVRRYGADLPDRWRAAGLLPRFSDAALRMPEAESARLGLERDLVMFVE